MTVYIYTLSDPDTSKVLYVGQAIKPDKRLCQHIRQSRMNVSKKDKWIQSLITQNKKPLMTLIDECEAEKSTEVEQCWMHCWRVLNRGLLLNDTSAGRSGWYYAKVRRFMYDNWSMLKPDEIIKCYICKGEIEPETARLDYCCYNDESWQCAKCYEKYGSNDYLD